ncbi:hypothetical protein DFP74_1109 [Nocardiopsis sp. Huas11]|uniref:hypothetical protein n=1 Tax=Nocardiopsis sp. Huas11 TaxID=2183912 RepID=UPI000EB01540|nr:hypothetical protein [Nocardiopsis sp. Huas11]RKS05510.1 hypothetical protein DFP74_1109 [Nocardiopsis sp. Huas11]
MDTAAELESGSGDESGTTPTPTSASPVTQLSLWPPPRSTRHSGRRRRQVTVVSAVAVAVLALAGGIAAALTLTAGDGARDEAGQTHLDAFVGSWAGEMVQVDTEGDYVADWHAEVRIEDGAERGSTAWTTFACSGTLEQTAAEGDRLVYTYTETADPQDRCVDEAELTVSPDDGGLAAEWSSVTREGTRMISTGLME